MSKSIITVFIFLNILKLCTAQRYAFIESEIKGISVPRNCFIEFPDTITFYKLFEEGHLTLINETLLEFKGGNSGNKEFLVAGNSNRHWWLRLVPVDKDRKGLIQISLTDTTKFSLPEIEMGYEFEKNKELNYNLPFIKNLVDYCNKKERGIFIGNTASRKNKQSVFGYKFSRGKYKLLMLTVINSSRTDEKNIAFIDTGETLPVYRKYDNTRISPGQSKTYRLAFMDELPDDKITISFTDGSELILEL